MCARFLALLLMPLGATVALPPPKTLPAPPRGLNIVDWEQIRAAYEKGRHVAFPDGQGFQARNFRQSWLSRFDGRGFTVEPDGQDWRWGLELAGMPAQARIVAEGGRVTYHWNGGVKEWFVNGTTGLEHGFTLSAPREIRLSVRGGLHPRQAGPDIEFVDNDGAARIRYANLTARDADGRAVVARMTAEHNEVVIRLAPGARFPVTVDPIAQQASLSPFFRRSTDYFGWSVAVSGDTVVVGAVGQSSAATGVNGSQTDNSAPFAGAVYVFVRNGGVWSVEAFLKASNTNANDRFGNSVSIFGDTVVVGAPSEASSATGINGDQTDNSAAASGAAYVFTRNNGAWTQQAYLKASNTNSPDNFGYSVCVAGDTVVVGAFSEASAATGVNGNQSDNSAPNAGAAYVFVRSNGAWTQQAYLKASNTDSFDRFGAAVAVSGDTVLVGAYGESSSAQGINGNQGDNSASSAGAAYVFTRTNGAWGQQAYLKASNAQASDQMGYSVALSGDTAVVGAVTESSAATGINGNQADNSAPASGAAYVFVRNNGVWTQQAYLKPSNTGANDRFGFSSAVSGDTVVVGAEDESSAATGVNGNQSDNTASNSGAAYVFVRNNAAWSQQAYLKASDTHSADNFGLTIGVSGDTVVVGAPFKVSFGAAYTFAPPSCSSVAVPAAAQTPVAVGDFAAGVTLTLSTAGEASLAADDHYSTDANGAITVPPTVGTGAYTYFSAQSPVGPPVIGGMKLYNGLPIGALVGLWGAPGASAPTTAAFLLGATSSPVVPNVAGNGARLFLMVNDQFYNDNSGQFTTIVADGACRLPPILSLAHNGSFVLGQNAATYTVTVSNPSASIPTNGTVAVTEVIPAGLTLVSMAGPGWICPGTASNDCTRNDLLPGGQSYPPLTITVDVATNAGSSITNQVNLTGGAFSRVIATDPTTISPYSACDATRDGHTDAADLQAIVNEALGVATAAHDLQPDGKVNLVDVQIVVNAVLLRGCVPN